MTSTSETDTQLVSVAEEHEDVDADITSNEPLRKITRSDWEGIFPIMASTQEKLQQYLSQFQDGPCPTGYEIVTEILDDFDAAVGFLRNTVEAITAGAEDSPAFKDVEVGASSKKSRKSKSKSPSSGSDITSIKKRVSAEEKEAKAKAKAEEKEVKAKARAEAKAAKAAAKAQAKADKAAASASASSSSSGSDETSDSKPKKRKRSTKKDLVHELAPAPVPVSTEYGLAC